MLSKAPIIILAIGISIFVSCSKGKDGSPENPTNPDSFKQEAITIIHFDNLVSGFPTSLYVQYRGTTRNYFNKDAAGVYRIEFHGLNGRAIVEGNPRHMGSSSNLTQWPIRTGDTIRVFKNGAKYRDYVTEIEDDINDGIIYPISVFNQTITQQVADQAKADLNAFTAAGGLMSSINFKIQ